MPEVSSLGHRQTYESISSITLGADTTGVEFMSIPSNFTDLCLITSILGSTAAAIDVDFCFNGDTSSNYSWTTLYGTGSSVISSRVGGFSSIRLGYVAGNTGTARSVSQVDIISYSNTNILKTVLVSHAAPNNFIQKQVGLWRNTSAISSLRVIGAFRSGSTFSLYGIRAAV